MPKKDAPKGISLRQCAEPRYHSRLQAMLPGSGSSCSSSCSAFGSTSGLLTVPI